MSHALTVPNCLTLLRILAVPVFAITVWYGRMTEACLIFAAAGLTDLLDGFIARRFNQKSDLGAILDPAADKLLMTTAFILLAFPRTHYVVQIPAWVAILAISRDLVISFVALHAMAHFNPAQFQPTFLGKVTTTVQLLAIALALLLNAFPQTPAIHAIPRWCFYLVALMVLASGFQYFFRATHTRADHA